MECGIWLLYNTIIGCFDWILYARLYYIYFMCSVESYSYDCNNFVLEFSSESFYLAINHYINIVSSIYFKVSLQMVITS